MTGSEAVQASVPHRTRRRSLVAVVALTIVLFAPSLAPSLAVAVAPGAPATPTSGGAANPPARATGGTASPDRVIVTLASAGARSIAAADADATAVEAELAGTGAKVTQRHREVGALSVTVDGAARRRLAASRHVRSVIPDPILAPSAFVPDVVHLNDADQAWAGGWDGTGQSIAVIDTGVDATHPYLKGRVVDEACFRSTATCPNGQTTMTGAGAAAPCATCAPSDAAHGTHVAGIAAGRATDPSQSNGTAKGASIVALMAATPITDTGICGATPTPCLRFYGSDLLAALNYLHSVHATRPVAAVNLSLSAGLYTGTCDDVYSPFVSAITNLRNDGTAIVAAAGNDVSLTATGFPACMSGVVAVSATDFATSWPNPGLTPAGYANRDAKVDVFAIGTVTSSVPGGTFSTFQGTSMASPQVAATFALARQAKPSATIDQIRTAIVDTGQAVYYPPGLAGVVSAPLLRSFSAVQEIALGRKPPIAPLLTGAWRCGANGARIDVAAPGVLATAVDPLGRGLSAELVASPANGSVSLNPDGSFRYTSKAGFNSFDSFRYRVRDANGVASNATDVVTLDDLLPVAGADAYSTMPNTALHVAAPGILANDRDPDGNAVVVIDDPTSVDRTGLAGTLTVTTTGGFDFVPTPGFVGVTSFRYKAVSDTRIGTSEWTTVTITVSAPSLDRVSIDIPGRYHLDGPLATGNFSVAATAAGVMSVHGYGSVALVPAPGRATVGVDVDSFLFLPIYFGSVRVVDGPSGATYDTPIFFGSVYGATGTAMGSADWFSFTNGFAPYHLSWRVDDKG